jgi:hypothetical protein
MNEPRNPDLNAPINLWWRLRAFRTEAECNAEKNKELEPITNSVKALSGMEPAARVRFAARASVFAKAYACVSEDDPRLKGN